MTINQQILMLLQQINLIAKKKHKKTGFIIGNTAKQEQHGLYFTPLRETVEMVVAGVVVYSEDQAINIAQQVDGKVDYVLVDAEKKIVVSDKHEVANVERAVREAVNKSRLWVYKGNDLSVDALDALITYLTKDDLRGVGGKKIAVLGAGNLGCKLALKLVERGAEVYLHRRDIKKLKVITAALNMIKPVATLAKVRVSINALNALKNADIIIGLTGGHPIITGTMIDRVSSRALIIDAGKGTLTPQAVNKCHQRNLPVFRLDVTAALEGYIATMSALEGIVTQRMGRRFYEGFPIVSGGLLAKQGEWVVDNINHPRVIYGLSDGKGDFVRHLNSQESKLLQQLKKLVTL